MACGKKWLPAVRWKKNFAFFGVHSKKKLFMNNSKIKYKNIRKVKENHIKNKKIHQLCDTHNYSRLNLYIGSFLVLPEWPYSILIIYTVSKV